MVAARLHDDARDIDVTEPAIRLSAQLHRITMTRHHAVADTDILTQTGRRTLQRDTIVVGVGYHALNDNIMTAVKVERIIIVVVAIENLDAFYLQAVTGQIMLHPAT